LVGLLLVACGERSEDLLGEVKARGEIRIASDPNYAPQSFLKEDGTLDGFDVDVAREIARRLGVTPKFVTPEWDAVIAGNWDRQWDIVVASAAVTKERTEVLYFSVPYYYTPAQFAVRADLAAEVTRVEDFAGRVVCVGSSTTYEDYLNGRLELEGDAPFMQVHGVTVKTVASDAECIQALQAGSQEIEGVLTSLVLVTDAVSAGGPLVSVDAPVFYESLAVALDKSVPKSESLLAAIDEIIGQMHQDGTLTQLSLKWYGVDLTVKE
ncbi:MAG: transporter substrate-binding domain-containing protein, partial [Anaerolineae bacterium]